MKYENITKEKLEEFFAQGWTQKKIAEFFKVDRKVIRERQRILGVPLPQKEKKIEETHVCQKCGKTYKQSKYHPYCCKQCAGLIDLSTDSASTELGKQICELRKQGLTYSQISKQLNCSKSTVGYYCKIGSRDKKKYYQENIADKYIRNLSKRIGNFKSRKMRTITRFKCKSYNNSFRSRVSNFVGNWEYFNNMKSNKRFGYKEVLEHIGGWQTKCYLTGRPLDLKKDDYEFDHIVPISKGGSCELDNLGVTCRDANQSKNNLSLEEYLQLCKEVLENFGYTVEKK